MNRNTMQNQQFDEEWAQCHLKHTGGTGCVLGGPAKEESSVRQCLTDAGCDAKTITAFLKCREVSDVNGALALLENHRVQLLGHIHQVQFRIAMLDDMLDRAGYVCLCV